MKRSNVSQFIGAGVISLSLAIATSVLPASAQTDTAPISPGNTTGNTTAPNTAYDNSGDRDFDWGWLGLLGLLGLAGLTRKPEERVSYREPDVATRSSYRE